LNSRIKTYNITKMILDRS